MGITIKKTESEKRCERILGYTLLGIIIILFITIWGYSLLNIGGL